MMSKKFTSGFSTVALLTLFEYASADLAFYCINKVNPEFQRFGNLDFYKECKD